jgi:large subunit ribosomal protein L29
MQPSELREIGLDELAQKEREAREELFRLRMRRSTGQVENRMQIRSVRRDLARILTVATELKTKRAKAAKAQG